MRTALVFVGTLLASGLAGCIDGSDEPVNPAGLGPAVPAPVCLAPCPRVLDDSPGDSWEASAAVNPTDAGHIVVGSVIFGPDEPEVLGGMSMRVFAHVSHDGGQSWRTARMPFGDEVPPDHPLRPATWLADPAVAFLPDGTVLYAFLAFHSYNTPTPDPVWVDVFFPPDLYVARSSDDGLTYPPDEIRQVARAGGVGISAIATSPGPLVDDYVLLESQDKPWIAVSPGGDVLLAWSEIIMNHPVRQEAPGEGRYDLLGAVSKDGGRTWGPHTTIVEGGYPWFASPVALPGGGWAVAFHDSESGAPDTFLAVSPDADGASWQVAKVAGDAARPVLKVQARDGEARLLLAYLEILDYEARIQEPVLRWSDDVGAAWSEPLRLDETEGSGFNRLGLDVGPDGLAWVTFFHPRGEDPGARAEFLAVTVRDGVLSGRAVLDGAFEGPTWMTGDYTGLAARPGGAIAVWTTQRDGAYDLLVARLEAPEGA